VSDGEAKVFWFFSSEKNILLFFSPGAAAKYGFPKPGSSLPHWQLPALSAIECETMTHAATHLTALKPVAR
jgi:hypothetical protein